MDDQDDLPVIELAAEPDRSRESRPIGPRRRRLTAAALVALLVAGALGGVAFGRGRHHATERTAATIVLPTATATVAPPTTLDANAEFIGETGVIAPGVGWALNGYALYRTVDDGEQWQNITPPGLPDPIGHIDALTFLDADHAWVAAAAPAQPFTIWRTVDGGRTWQPLRENFCTPTPAVPSCAPTAIDFLDAQHGWALVSSDGSAGRLLTTTDGGTTWSPVGVTAFGGSLHFADPTHGWAVTDARFDANNQRVDGGGALFRTIDGGRTWQPISPPPHVSPGGTAVPIAAPQFFGANAVVEARVTHDHAPDAITVAVTRDGGGSWTVHPTPIVAGALLHSPIADQFVATTDTNWTLLDGKDLYSTDDAGAHWTTVVPTGGTLRAISFADFAEGWVLADPRACTASDADCPRSFLYTTVDGGATWHQRSPSIGITANRLP